MWPDLLLHATVARPVGASAISRPWLAQVAAHGGIRRRSAARIDEHGGIMGKARTCEGFGARHVGRALAMAYSPGYVAKVGGGCGLEEREK